MNTRQAIQPLDQPVVLYLDISPSRKRFIAALSDGCRLFRTDNCLTTYQPRLGSNDTSQTALTDDGVGVVAVLDDRYCAFVKGGRTSQGSPNVLFFWDATLAKSVSQLDFHEPILSIKLTGTNAVVVLLDRAVLLEYQEIVSKEQQDDDSLNDGTDDQLNAPNKIKALHKTATNQFGLAILRRDMLVLPAQAVGQVQLIPLPSGSKRVFRAHNTQLRAFALSEDGQLIATCSVQGTLVRVFDTITLDQVAEFRRGMDHAIVFSLAISPGKRWVACTSDKGTLHIFDLRPDQSASTTSAPSRETNRPLPAHRKSGSHSTARAPSSIWTPSVNSVNRSSPPTSVQYQGSVQEYYGLLPPPTHTSPTGQAAAISAISAFKNSSLAPKVLKDIRSVASCRFWLGNESPHWQGGAAYSYTTAPDGTKKRVRNPVTPLANDPSGKPPKGLVTFAPDAIDDDDGAILYVIGGGGDPRWERIELARNDPTKPGPAWVLSNVGYRKYLNKQFVD